MSCTKKAIIEIDGVQSTTSSLIIKTSSIPHPQEVEAANIFKDYYHLIFENPETNIDFYIGQNNITLQPNEVSYNIKDSKVYIEGGSPLYTIYAVYEFLEKVLGCVFLSPSFEIIPRQNVFQQETLNYRYSPNITTRTVHSDLFYEDSFFAQKHKVTEQAFPGYVPKARVHTFHKFLPADQYFEDHPEYYALRNGQRRTTQLCLTNEDVLNIVMDSIQHYLTSSPESFVISVSQDDNTQYCKCDHCEIIHKREESPSGSMIYFVNKIAKAFPDKQISTLAYQYTRKAPKHIKPEPNVLITLCSIECDRSASIEDKCKDFLDDLIGWGKISNNIRIWDYTTQFTNFLAPFPNLHTIQPNIKLFEKNNAKWIFEQHSRNPSELFELRSFLTAKLLWKPDANVDSLMHSFCNSYYGNAAPYIMKYIDHIHTEIQSDSSFFLFLYGDPSQAFNSYLRKENLEFYNTLFDEAETTVGGDSTYLAHIKAARLSTIYSSLEMYKQNIKQLTRKQPNLIKQEIDRFEHITKMHGITAMNEMRYTVDEYLLQYKASLARAANENKLQGKSVVLETNPKKYADENPSVLTDGAYGGNSFFSNWLGFEGNDCIAIIDLEEIKTISNISSAFLQVTNHIVFLPTEVTYSISQDGNTYKDLATIPARDNLSKSSKINDIQYFNYSGTPNKARYIKIVAKNRKTAPEWHNASGLPAWIFLDEIEAY